MSLTIDHREQGGCAVLVIHGDLDVATSPDLRTAALATIHADPGPVIIDASEMGYCDSTGLGVFVRVAAVLDSRGQRLAIAGPQPGVRHILEETGLDEAFVVTGTVTEATARLRAGL
jgi:anti-sigma B factor antagonist